MLSTSLGFLGDMSHCLVLALVDLGFSQELLPPWSQNVLWNWVYKCTFEYYRKYEVKITRILFKFSIYPSYERALKNRKVKWKIVGKLSFGDMIFFYFTWLPTITFSLFLHCAKESIFVEILKVSETIGKSLPLCKGSRKCKNKIIAPCCFLEKETSDFLK